ncbi:MAG: oligosaccharide flippase family protein, partial [Candidatus Daviesbacteria bacterium]|nr:oligosaccharide flippase family protein [Candidatus Daviesbacteria bacterium]
LIFWLSQQGAPVYVMVLGYVLAWGIHASGTLLFVLKFAKNTLPVFDFKYIFKLFKEVLPLSATLILNVLYFRADSFILAYFKNPAEVGVYNLAYQVFQSILVLPTFIMNSYYPMMLQARKISKIAPLILLFLSFSILLTTYYLSPFIIKLITGSGFVGSVESLRILSFGFPAYFLSALLMWVMVAKKMYKKLLIVYGLGLIVNIAANLYFIPLYGYVAASWITGISEYLILAMQAVILFKR